jgi:hypothetical protein
MRKENVESNLKELAKSLMLSYQDCYKTEEDVIELAKQYFLARTELEIDRDSQLSISLEDYKEWIKDVFYSLNF